MSTSSEDILLVGDQFYLPMPDGTQRRAEVIRIDEQTFTVKFYKPNGVGPYICELPHGKFPGRPLVRVFGEDDRAGRHESYWKWHPDFTGKYDD